MELRKGKQIKRKPLSDTTNCPYATPPPTPPLISVSASTTVTVTTIKKRGSVARGKLQSEGSKVASSSSSRRLEDEERRKENQSPAFSPSSFTSPGISASEVSCSERVYKRRRADPQRLSALYASSCPPVLRSNKKEPCEPGSFRMQSSTASMMTRRRHGTVRTESSNEHKQSRMCRSAPAMVKQKKRRYSEPEIPKCSALPEDYVEEQKAHFAEVDAFELPEESVSSDELD